MRVALYARVSTESQQARGTIGSQLAVLRERVGAEGDEVVAEFCDDGHSGARLDRPGLDALRDAAEAGLIERVWCLSPDRLARVYAYQVIVLDELARHGVSVRFTDAPPIDDDPQAKLLTQVQGVIAEYERAKIAERYRRGKLFRSRAGEVLAWRTPYGYRRQPRDAHGPARLEVFEPEAAIVRRIFDDYVHGGHSLREIIRRLAADQIPPPTGRDRLWSTLHAEQAAAQRGLHRADLRQPHRSRPRPAPRASAAARSPAPARTGSPSRCPPSSMTRPSRRPGGSAATTASGAHAGPNPANGCCVAWSNAASARSARTATRGAAATAPGTATTTAATTTRSKPAGTTGAAPNATSAPTPSTRSCSTRSAPPCCAPTCSPPANRPSPCAPPPPTTNCSPPSWPAWTASSTPPTPNAAASSTSTRPASSSYPSCNAAPPTSSTAAATSTNAATPSPRNARS